MAEKLAWDIYDDISDGCPIEEHKAMPWNAVYDEFCLRNNVPVGLDFIKECQEYEKNVTLKR